jgi:hypothetical protein
LFLGTYNPIRAHLGTEMGGADAMSWEPSVLRDAKEWRGRT